MGNILQVFLMMIYFATVICVVIYMIRLLIRLVKAVEKIAYSVEKCCDSKASESS
jgi:hypothetical protein